jgi:hypothetical protein
VHQKKYHVPAIGPAVSVHFALHFPINRPRYAVGVLSFFVSLLSSGSLFCKKVPLSLLLSWAHMLEWGQQRVSEEKETKIGAAEGR